jgi:hypothetical protein
MAGLFNQGYALLIGVGESAYKPLSLPVTVKPGFLTLVCALHLAAPLRAASPSG